MTFRFKIKCQTNEKVNYVFFKVNFNLYALLIRYATARYVTVTP